ncbi:MAG: ParA family protein [Tagaea sp.]|nr:ParA family protein [Tagaea sp.]
MKTIAFFNNKGGVGKTSLVYHVAWMLSDMGKRVLVLDLDPQANLSSMFLGEEALEDFWPDDGEHVRTVWGSLSPIYRQTGGFQGVEPVEIKSGLWLVVGDLALGKFEDKLSQSFSGAINANEGDLRITSVFHTLAKNAALRIDADIVLMDVGPNLGATNRAVMIAADHVLIPMAPDLFSLQGLRNLGPTLREWRDVWSNCKDTAVRKKIKLDFPSGAMRPIGYVVMQHAMRLDRPVKAYGRWLRRIPSEYSTHVLADEPVEGVDLPTDDKSCVAEIKHYRSLMPLAMEARKPMFALRSADGAIGAHQNAVEDCRLAFKALAKAILERLETAGGGA